MAQWGELPSLGFGSGHDLLSGSVLIVQGLLGILSPSLPLPQLTLSLKTNIKERKETKGEGEGEGEGKEKKDTRCGKN